MLEQELVDLIKRDAATAGLYGDRVYPVVLPDVSAIGPGKPASLTYQLVATRHYPTLDGRIRPETVLEFDTWAGTYRDTAIADDALVNLLIGFYGPLQETLINTIVLQMQFARFEPNARIYRRVSEFRIFYQPISISN